FTSSRATRSHSTLPFVATHPATTDTYPLSLHDALPIWCRSRLRARQWHGAADPAGDGPWLGSGGVGHPAPSHGPSPAGSAAPCQDRKSTRLNSSHVSISYAVFCLKKKNNKQTPHHPIHP